MKRRTYPRKGPKQFRVGVFAEKREGRTTRWAAYTVWYHPEWINFVGEFLVEATTGEEAKKIAIQRAKEAAANAENK